MNGLSFLIGRVLKVFLVLLGLDVGVILGMIRKVVVGVVRVRRWDSMMGFFGLVGFNKEVNFDDFYDRNLMLS